MQTMRVSRVLKVVLRLRKTRQQLEKLADFQSENFLNQLNSPAVTSVMTWINMCISFYKRLDHCCPWPFFSATLKDRYCQWQKRTEVDSATE